MGVRAFTGLPTIHISGCPANPDWIVWAVVELLLGHTIELDADRRPTALYSTGHTGQPEAPIIHDKCPRNPGLFGTPVATHFGEDGHCLEALGLPRPVYQGALQRVLVRHRRPHVSRAAPGTLVHRINAPCHGCVEKTFPGPQSFYEPYQPES